MAAYVKLNLVTGDVLTQTRIQYIETQYESAVSVITIGRHLLFIPADYINPHISSGADFTETITLAVGKYVRAMGFDVGEKGFFSLQLPKSWNGGTVSFRPKWLNTAGGSGNVVFGLAGATYADDSSLTLAVGTAQTSTDAALTALDMQSGPESAAITLANGTPGQDDFQRFDIERLSSGNTYASRAYLMGLSFYFTTDASTDD